MSLPILKNYLLMAYKQLPYNDIKGNELRGTTTLQQQE
jgi:hypothetical protein